MTTKRARVLAAIAGRPVDRPPVAFWRHVPEVDGTAAGLAEAMLAFHQRWDLDLVKVMSSGVYCVEDWGCRVAYAGAPSGAKQCVAHAVTARADWARVRPLDPSAPALARELEAVRRIRTGRPDDAPILHTVFSPLTIARKLAGDRALADLRTEPDAVLPALEAITDTMARYAAAALEAGADGIFYATQAATPDVATREECQRFEVPAARRILEPVRRQAGLVVLHVHGAEPYVDTLASLPVDALNWHDRRTRPRLADARRAFAGALMGGLDEWHTLREGAPAAAAAEVRDAIAQAGRSLVVAPGCVLPLDVPDAALQAVIDATRRMA